MTEPASRWIKETLSDFACNDSELISSAIARLTDGAKSFLAVLDADGIFAGFISDADLRLGILAGVALDEPVRTLFDREIPPSSLKVTEGMNSAQLDNLLTSNNEDRIAIVSDKGVLLGIYTTDGAPAADESALQAMVMAGGFGKRLYPLTEDTPKPMLPIGNEPILEGIVKRLRDSGINEVNISTHYKREEIANYFGDGSRLGVDITYIYEENPLGTAGALGLMEQATKPILVINGDILTKINFRAMYEFHRRHKADLTMGVTQYLLEVAFGVVETDGFLVKSLVEKPKQRLLVNAGIYLLDPSVQPLIKRGERLDMPDFIKQLLSVGKRVVSFPVLESWLDVGNLADYKKASEEASQNQNRRKTD